MTQEDSMMAHAPLTPGEDRDPEPTNPVVDYSPATVPYNEAFENSLMNAILYNHTKPVPRTPLDSIPVINPTTLPVPLSSHLRTYSSPVPGILLTHANGYHTGGPGPSHATVSEFAKKFIKENGIEDAGQLERVVEEKIRERLEMVKERMHEREDALERNKQVERDLGELQMQRAAELSVAESIRGKKG